MPQTAAELAMMLRTIYTAFIDDVDRRILSGESDPKLANPDFIEGMLTVVESAENLSGLNSLPPEVLQALRDYYNK